MSTFTKIFPIVKLTTKYDQRMKKLSCKIFNEYHVPEIDKKDLLYGLYHPPLQQNIVRWHRDLRTVERHTERPLDIDPRRNYKYYPAHPQIRALTHTLREYGLFRDEHRDFNEEMKQIAISRGKTFRERRGPNTKKK